MAKLFGTTGYVKVGSKVLCVRGWTATETGDKTEVTDTCDAGKKAYLYGATEINGSFNWYHDTADPYVAPPASLRTGEEVALYLYIETAGDYYYIPNAVIDDVTLTSDIANPTEGTAAFTSSGSAYTVPGNP